MPLKKKKIVKKVLKRKPTKKIAKRAIIKPPKTLKKTRKSGPRSKLEKSVVGLITHYFPKVNAAVIKLKTPLCVGESIKVKGHTTDFTQTVTSIQMDREPITRAKPGQEIGLAVGSRVRSGDKVYRI